MARGRRRAALRWRRRAGACATCAAGTGPPLVLLHGFASSIYTWSEVLPALAAQHDVIALDFPGFGGHRDPPDADGRRPGARGAGGDGRPRPRRLRPRRDTAWAAPSPCVTAATHPQRVRRLVLIDAAGFNLAAADRPAVVRALGAVPPAVFELLPLARPATTLGLRQVFHDDRLLTRERWTSTWRRWSVPGTAAALRSLLASRDGLDVPARSAGSVRRRSCCGAGTTAGSTCRKPTCSSPPSPARARWLRTAGTCRRRSGPRESRSCCSSSSRPTHPRGPIGARPGRLNPQTRALRAIRIAGGEGHGGSLRLRSNASSSHAGPSSAGPLRSPAVCSPRSTLRSSRWRSAHPRGGLAATRLRMVRPRARVRTLRTDRDQFCPTVCSRARSSEMVEPQRWSAWAGSREPGAAWQAVRAVRDVPVAGERKRKTFADSSH